MSRIAVAVFLLVPSLALAKPPKILATEISSDDHFNKATRQAIDNFVAGALRDQGFEVITPADVAVLLGVERQRQLLGCGESSCLAELGGALGADYVVHGNLAVLDQASAMDFTLVDAKGRARNQVRELVPSMSSTEMIKAVDRLIPRLVRPLRAEAAPAAGGLTAAAPTGPSHTVSYALLGGGAVLAAAGLVVGGIAQRQADGAVSQPATPATLADVNQRLDTAHNLSLASTGLLGAGVVAAAAGLVLLFTGSTPEPSADAPRVAARF